MHWDYCIIGGGVLGCAIGKTILEKEPEASILIIEKNAYAGQGNTIRSNAAYRNIFDTTINIALASSSINYYKSQELEQKEDFGRREIGYLFLLSEEQYRQYSKPQIEHNGETLSFFSFLDSQGIGYELYDEDQLKDLFPELELEPQGKIATLIGAKPIKKGFLGMQCGNFAPDLVVQHYLNKFKEKGGKIQYHSKVISLKLGKPGSAFDPEYIPKVWEEKQIQAVEVQRGQDREFISADTFILATGAWINELLAPLGARSLVAAKKRQLFTIDNVGSFVNNPNFPTGQPIFPFTILPTGGVFIKPVQHASNVVIGTSDKIGRPFEPTYNPQQQARREMDDPRPEEDFYALNILPVLQSYFPSVFDEKTQIKGSAGHYAYSIDGYPVIDEVVDNLFFASGTSGSGIMKADSVARIVNALVRGEDHAELFGGTSVEVARFGIKYRDLPHETLVL